MGDNVVIVCDTCKAEGCVSFDKHAGCASCSACGAKDGYGGTATWTRKVKNTQNV